jgi:hypothetical protein
MKRKRQEKNLSIIKSVITEIDLEETIDTN